MKKEKVLCKRVCKHCMNQTPYKWNKTDDKLWAMGKIVCPHITISPTELFCNDINAEAYQNARSLVNEYPEGDWPVNIKRVLKHIASYSNLMSIKCEYRLEHNVQKQRKKKG